MYMQDKLDSDKHRYASQGIYLIYKLTNGKIEIPTIGQIHIPQPIIEGHNYKIGATRIQYQVNNQPNTTYTQQAICEIMCSGILGISPHATPTVISVVT